MQGTLRGDEVAVAATARDFFAALQKGDQATLRRLLIAGAQQPELHLQRVTFFPAWVGGELREVIVQGKIAAAHFTLRREPGPGPAPALTTEPTVPGASFNQAVKAAAEHQATLERIARQLNDTVLTLRLSRDAGDWRVQAFEVPGFPALSVNFSADPTLNFAGRLESLAFDGLTAVDVPRLTAGWQSDANGADRAGPFEVRVKAVMEHDPATGPDRPSGTGMLTLQLVARGLPSGVTQLLRVGGRHPSLRITAADGRDLFRSDVQPFFPARTSTPSLPETGMYEEDWQVPLKNLLADLDVIHEVRGRVRFPLPAQVHTVEVSALQPGAAARTAEGELTLVRIGPAVPAAATQPAGGPATAPAVGMVSLEFAGEGLAGRPLRWLACDASGRGLSGGWVVPTLTGSFSLRAPVVVARVRFKTVTVHEAEYPFLLRDIPLPRPPRELERARFPGRPAPVTVACQAVPPAGSVPAPLTLRVTNYCQKDVDRLRLRLTCVGAAGQVLKTVDHDQAQSDFRQGLRVIVHAAVADRPGQTPITVPAFASPPGTRSVDVTVLQVGFTDATTWEPPGDPGQP
jgi:hypothetical protein